MNSEKKKSIKLRPAMTDFMIFVAKKGEQVLYEFEYHVDQTCQSRMLGY